MISNRAVCHRRVSDEARRLLHDRMTESLIDLPGQQSLLFDVAEPAPLVTIPVLEEGRAALESHNMQMGLALSADELDYLEANFLRLQRNPSDAELMMFAQANSEHCRHKIFNASWTLDGEPQSTIVVRHDPAHPQDITRGCVVCLS